MNDHTVGLESILQAAVRNRICFLCGHAYLHELRGGLQAIHSAVELLARSGTAADPAIAAKASGIAKRAIATHESTITRVFDDIIADQHGPQEFDLGALAGECVQLLQNPAAARGVALSLIVQEALMIRARRSQLRISILGVILSALRNMPQGSQLRLLAARGDGGVALRFEGTDFGSWQALPGPAALATADLDDLILPVSQRVVAADGGRMWTEAAAGAGGALCIDYPVG